MLRDVMEICETLGIDDPIAWSKAIDAKTLDLWSAWIRVKRNGGQ